MSIQGIQLCVLPTVSSLGHMMKLDHQHFIADYDE